MSLLRMATLRQLQPRGVRFAWFGQPMSALENPSGRGAKRPAKNPVKVNWPITSAPTAKTQTGIQTFWRASSYPQFEQRVPKKPSGVDARNAQGLLKPNPWY